jgi:hypothetical protein
MYEENSRQTFRIFPGVTSFERSPGAYGGSKQFQKIHIHTEMNDECVPVTDIHLVLLVRP